MRMRLHMPSEYSIRMRPRMVQREGWYIGMAGAFGSLEESSRLEQIYVHSARLFVEQGFAATSMSEIANRVGISKAGLYHFVRSKEDVLFNLMTWAMDTLDAQVTNPARAIEDPLDRLAFIVKNHILNIGSHHFQGENPLTIIVDEPAGLSPERRTLINERKATYFRFVRSTILELEKDGRLNKIDPTNATFAVLGLVVWLSRWYKDSGKLPLSTIAADLTGFALRGVVPSAALEAAGYGHSNFPDNLEALNYVLCTTP